MKWLRSKPLDINELDESRIWHERYGGNADGDPEEAVVDDAGDENGDIVMASQSQPAKTKRNSGKTKSRRRTGGEGVPVGAEANGG